MITSRIDKVTDVRALVSSMDYPPPRSVKIELEGRCNLACSFCAHGNKETARKSMDRKFYSRIIREMRAAGVEELGVFYIGESFMCSWLPDAIREAKDVGFPYVFLTTNGTIATPDKVEACMKAGLDSLKFSLNNADAEQFTTVTGAAQRWFGKALDNLKAARRIRDAGGYQCGIYASSILYDGEQGEKMRALVDSVRDSLDEHYWLPLFEFAGDAREGEAALEMKPTIGNPGRLDMMRQPLPCWAVFTEGHISCDGQLTACCFDSDGRFSMGDLNAQSFLEAWNSEKFRALRAAHLMQDVKGTVCETCIS